MNDKKVKKKIVPLALVHDSTSMLNKPSHILSHHLKYKWNWIELHLKKNSYQK